MYILMLVMLITDPQLDLQLRLNLFNITNQWVVEVVIEDLEEVSVEDIMVAVAMGGDLELVVMEEDIEN